jgi:polyisoprenoid-binding protein YceI
MGNEGSTAKSSSKVENDTLVVNETEMNFLNETVNETAVSMTVDAASSCSQNTDVKQEISLEDLNIEGDLSLIGITQKVVLDVNFSCINKTQVHADIVNDMTSKVMSALDATNNTELQNSITAQLAAKSENGGFQIGAGGSTSVSESDIKNNTQIYNSNKANVQNIVKNKVQQTFDANMYSECVNNVSSSQVIGLKRIKVRGNVTLKDITQEAVISTFAECINEQSFGNKIVQAIAQDAGLKLETKADNKAENKSDVKAESTSIQTGMGPDLASSAMSGAFSVVSGLMLSAVLFLTNA